MIKALFKLLSVSLLALIGVVGLLFYRHQTAAQNRIHELETQNGEQQRVIARLEFARRVADFVVVGQSRQADGKLHTSLMMVEYDRDGRAMPPRSFDVVGNLVHVDALVIKFNGELVKQGDPLKGHALLLFEKIYGDAQAPADAARIDAPGQVPTVYRDADPRVSAFETGLWRQFWQLAGDEALRQQHGVEVAHGSGVFAPFQSGRRYTVTLGADGNVSLFNEPLPEIFRGLLKRADAR